MVTIEKFFTSGGSAQMCFCLSEVQKCWLLIYSSNFSQSQLTIFLHTHSATIRDHSSINYLLQVLVFWAKIGILSIISGSKNSKLNTF